MSRFCKEHARFHGCVFVLCSLGWLFVSCFSGKCSEEWELVQELVLPEGLRLVDSAG